MGEGGECLNKKYLGGIRSLQSLVVTKSLNMHIIRYVLEWGLSVNTVASGCEVTVFLHVQYDDDYVILKYTSSIH